MKILTLLLLAPFLVAGGALCQDEPAPDVAPAEAPEAEAKEEDNQEEEAERWVPEIEKVEVELPSPTAVERPYFNDLKVPETMDDLQKIQEQLLKVLPDARKASVAIRMPAGAGSGVIVSPDGLVLTAAHVSGGVDIDMTVIMEDGTEYPAVSLGLDSETDSAMIKIVSDETFHYAPIDVRGEYKLGDWCFSTAHPGGYDEDRGSVTRLGRLVWVGDYTIQSDCILIGGDSGGPLYDMNGRVIGINSRVGQIVEQSMHAPILDVVKKWDEMLSGHFIGEGGFAQRPEKGKGMIGVGIEPVEDDGGIRITRVSDESAGQKAGLEVDDVIIAIDGEPTPNNEELRKVLAEKYPQQKIVVRYKRGDEEAETTVKLDARLG